MDYEFKITVLEKELAHYREMQALQQAHLDAHDSTLGSLVQIAQRTERNLEALTVHVAALSFRMDTLTGNVDLLVKAPLREHPNGGSGR